MRPLACAVGLLAALVALGCGERLRSRVYGTVTYQGKPLAGALVTFVAADNSTFNADTRPDGAYEVAGIPRGPVKVSVQVPPPHSPPAPRPDRGKATPPPLPPSVVPPTVSLPDKYAS